LALAAEHSVPWKVDRLWAFRPALQKLEAQLPESFELIRIMGGFAPDTDEPMPEAMRNKLQEIWRTIQLTVPDTEFDFRYWDLCTPRRSTYRACRAVIATTRQGLTLFVWDHHGGGITLRKRSRPCLSVGHDPTHETAIIQACPQIQARHAHES